MFALYLHKWFGKLLFVMIFIVLFFKHANSQDIYNSINARIKYYQENAKIQVDTNAILSIKYIDSAIYLSSQFQFYNELIQSISQKANIYSAKKDFSEAHLYYNKALQLCDIQNNLKLKAKVLIDKANSYLMFDSLNLSVDYYLKALRINEKLNDKKAIADNLIQLGLTFNAKDSARISKELFCRAATIYIEINHNSGIIEAYNNIGKYYYNYERNYTDSRYFIEAKKYYNLSLEIALKINDLKSVARAYNNLGALLIEQHLFIKADEYIKKALDIRRKINDTKGITSCLYNLALIHRKIFDYHGSIKYLNESLELARKNDNKEMILRNLYVLSLAYESINKYKEAYKCQFEYSILNDKLVNEKNNKTTKELYAFFENEKKIEKIKSLNKENEIKELKLKNSKVSNYLLFIFLLIIAVVSFAIILFINHRNQKQKNRITKQAENLLLQLNSDLQSILNSSYQGFILLGLNGRIKHFNPIASELVLKFLKIKIENGIKLNDILNDKLLAKHNELFKLALEGENNSVIYNTHSICEEIFWFEFHYFPVINEKGIIGVNIAISDITKNKMDESKLKHSLEEKNTLIKEIHHRVKNNLQVIVSLINLQKWKFEDVKVQEELYELQERVRTMAFVHELLYKSENLAEIPFDEFIYKLVSNVQASNSNIVVKPMINVEKIFMNIEIAVPCGLLINELLSNTFKYAFSKVNEFENIINIEFYLHNDIFTFNYSDNGFGLAEGVTIENAETLGFQLIEILINNNLNGSFSIKNENGLSFNIKFPNFKK